MRPALALVLFAVACESVARSAGDEVAAEEPVAPAVAAAPVVEPTPHTKLRSSHRCSECHVAIAESWSSSAHAGSAKDPLYLAMRDDAKDASCDSCHAPLAHLLEPGSAVAGEGVTCDACHTAERVELDGERGRLILNPADNIKRGPLCDARDHYFHRVACVPMFERSEMCAGCHTLSRHSGAATIAVHGEYEEWKASPLGPSGSDASCQSCHMPTRDGEVAEGWDGPQQHSAHGTAATSSSPLHVALTLRPAADGRIAVVANVKNADAGHALPTGLPGRRLRIAARVVDESGAELDRWEHVYGTWLVDDAGNEVPFYAATRVAKDDRIAAEATRAHEFVLAAPGAARLELTLAQRAICEPLAERIGIAAPDERVLATATIDIPAPGAARRRRFARPLEVIQ